MIDKKGNSIWFFSISLTIVFFLFSLWGILNHELWMDEAHSFIIGRESILFSDLYENTKQEGHPMIWYILLWIINMFTHDVFYMQLLHIIISAATVFLMSYYGPFNKIKKVLFAFSYYFFFEYTILSRNYGLCLFFITIYLILISREHKNYLSVAIVLGLLANTHFLGLILSMSLVMTTGLIWWNSQDSFQRALKTLILPIVVILLSYLICIIHVLPEEASMFSKFERNGYLSFKRWSAWTIILKGLFQFPYVDNSSWNTNIFTQNKFIGFFLTILVSIVSVKSFINRPLSLFVFFSSVFSLSLFFFLELMHVYAVRHWGFVFMAFYAAIWFAEGLDQDRYVALFNRIRIPSFLSNHATVWRNAFLYTVLITQVSASIYMFVWDYYNPFCNAKAVAGYIKQNELEKELIIVSNYSSGIAINAFLPNKKFYYPEYHGFGTYGIWNIWPVAISSQELMHEIQTCKSRSERGNALLILNDLMYSDSLTFADTLNFTVKPLTKFEEGFSKQDTYQLFFVTYK